MGERIQGRGAAFNPGNRFERIHIDYDEAEEPRENKVQTVYFHDSSRSILAKNVSPDVPFTFSVNPYRGCEHGCIYCYARPSHEYLGFSAGLDFESRILVKMDAPELLEEAFRSLSFVPQVIALSGNTDCYQPVERKLQITRRVLEVFLKYRNPVGIITKNAMVLRDIDVLQEMAKEKLVSVTISITTTHAELASKMEPRASTPQNRFDALAKLAATGVPVGVNVAPVIPGLTDEEMPEILRRASDAGAQYADYILMRLPYAVKDLFCEWVQREFPERASKVLNRIRETRGGELSDPRFGSRMTGEGEFAEVLSNLFDLYLKKYKLDGKDVRLSTTNFQRPGQISLF
ncbi:MAG: radical SAM protein [Acidobacteria bacterium]|nr:MAG: radical SAM protein [Acidobacteriota bacterium]